MKVPFVDLRAEYEEIRERAIPAIERVVEGSQFILGDALREFERAFAERHGTRYCLGVASGTDALTLSLEALGIGSGDEVIVPVNTFAATALAVCGVGARPRFVDCDAHTYLLDVDRALTAVGERTKAFLPVHLYGRVLDMTRLKETGLPIVEDAAQAHGSDHRGVPAGAFGVTGCFSFYPSKNLGAWGDGGAIVTSDDGLRDTLDQLRNWGQSRKYHHRVKGHNSRLDTVQAAVLQIKLARIDDVNARRRKAAAFYNEHLRSDLPKPDLEGVFHLFVTRVANREALQEKLAEAGIQSGIHYPIPLHLQECFADLGHSAGDFPVAEAQGPELLSLPMYPQISQDQLAYVVEHVNRWAEAP